MQNPEQFYTLEEYWKLIETFPEHKYEYVDGIIRMMTGGTPAHSHLAANLIQLIGSALRDQDCIVYTSDVAVSLSENRIYYPDVTVSCDPADWTRTKALVSPTIVIEVLSPKTEHRDKLEKLEAYRRYPTIQDVLIVDSRRCYIEHYHRTGVSSWNIFTYERREDIVELMVIDASLSVSDIYRKVYLSMENE